MVSNVGFQTIRLADILAALPETQDMPACTPSRRSALRDTDTIEVAELLGIDFAAAPFTVEDLQLGLEMELDLGDECTPSMVDLLDDDLVELGMIAVANLRERSDYYTRMSQANAPGDPPLRARQRAEVGAD